MQTAPVPLATPDLSDANPVNLAYQAVRALGQFFAGAWPYLMLFAGLMLAILFAVSWLLRRWTARREAAPAATGTTAAIRAAETGDDPEVDDATEIMTVDERAADEAAADETTADETTADETTADETTADETTAADETVVTIGGRDAREAGVSIFRG